MKERPILFSGAMVRAIRENRKTQTRRILKHQPIKGDVKPSLDEGVWSAQTERSVVTEFSCPKGLTGDRLWVKETFQPLWAADEPGDWTTGRGYKIGYVATDGIQDWVDHSEGEGELTQKCKPSIFMPRWASRITLEITAVRVERLQDISEADALAEGVDADAVASFARVAGVTRPAGFAYRDLWESINGPGSWAKNPWVWVIEFREVRA